MASDPSGAASDVGNASSDTTTAKNDEKVLEEAMGAVLNAVILDQAKEMMSDMGLMDVG